MEFQIAMTGFVALYIFMLAGFAGWVIIGRVPAILHTPLMSGSNFVHGIVVVGGHIRSTQCQHGAGTGDRLLRRIAGCRQRGGRLCGHRSHARDVPGERTQAHHAKSRHAEDPSREEGLSSRHVHDRFRN